MEPARRRGPADPRRDRRGRAPVADRSTASCSATRPRSTSASTCAASGGSCSRLASLATAAAVAISGLIGFVGPGRARTACGCWPGRPPGGVLPLSAIFGAVLLSAADLVARLAGDIPVGVVMALIGAPFFLFLLTRTRSGYEL